MAVLIRRQCFRSKRFTVFVIVWCAVVVVEYRTTTEHIILSTTKTTPDGTDTVDNAFNNDTKFVPSRPAKNVLDCNSKGSLCRYFYPTTFYESGPGRENLKQARNQLYGNPNRTLPLNYVRCIQKEKPSQPFPPNDWTFIHVRKAGGTTMKFATCGQGYDKLDRTTVKIQLLYNEMGQEQFIRYHENMANTTTFVTFVRDPVSRFVSAMGEIQLQQRDKTKCATTTEQHNATFHMQCILGLIQQGQVVDEHLVPASIILYQATFGSHARVAVMDIKDISTFIQSIGVKPFRINQAHGVKLQYAVNLLDEDMIRDICLVYKSDVHMMRSLGMAVPKCDKHVPIL